MVNEHHLHAPHDTSISPDGLPDVPDYGPHTEAAPIRRSVGIRMPLDDYLRLKRDAADRGLPMGEIVLTSLEQSLFPELRRRWPRP